MGKILKFCSLFLLLPWLSSNPTLQRNYMNRLLSPIQNGPFLLSHFRSVDIRVFVKRH